jgi:hypothetical protein
MHLPITANSPIMIFGSVKYCRISSESDFTKTTGTLAVVNPFFKAFELISKAFYLYTLSFGGYEGGHPI